MSGSYALRSITKKFNKVVPGNRMKSSEVQALQIHHDQTNMEFYINLGKDKAFLQYDVIDPATGAVDLQHTVVPEVFQGQGIAKVLAKEVMDHFAVQNKQMRLTCWYLQKYHRENPNALYENKILND